MSRCIAVDQKFFWLAWWTPRFDSLKFVNYTIIENAHVVRKKILFFYVAVICTTNATTRRTEQIRTCVCRYDQSA